MRVRVRTSGDERDVRSGGNALDDFPRERAAAPVVDLRGLGVAVTREVLDGLERDVLRQQVGDDEDPERVRADRAGEARVLQARLQHAPNSLRHERRRADARPVPDLERPKQRSRLRRVG